ncbi:hypothetical protein JWZ98_11230 [Methylomonas sp. EFPC1]|uniref:hypothetical protein n=1 Tax=Methylomonas sp. EFPC1 TaxID=2812647 RepID=UPI0019673C78|nr:hypothetical protein [Methylomonas sp. EFPC1]QSB03449.1 hypothetical protein JWZ98_11230 [Methylomonas sp. EFPC1]
MSEQEIDLGIGSSPLPELDKGIQLPTVSEVIDGSAFDSDLVPLLNGGDTAQLQTCLADFGLVAMSAEEFITAGVDALNKSLVQACKAGVAFWAAQESLKNTTPPGGVENFKEWIDKAGLPQQRVYECIRLAKYYARLPENQRGKMLAIGKKQALLLAKMPQEVIDRVAENGTDVLDEAETMTYDQLRDLLKTAERRNQNLNAEVENRDAVIAKLKQRDNRDYMFLPQTIKAVKAGQMQAPTLMEFADAFNAWIDRYVQRQHPENKHVTRQQVWGELSPLPPHADLLEMKRQAVVLTVKRASIIHKSPALGLSDDELARLAHLLEPHLDSNRRFWCPKPDKLLNIHRNAAIINNAHRESIARQARQFNLSSRQITNIRRQADTGMQVDLFD